MTAKSVSRRDRRLGLRLGLAAAAAIAGSAFLGMSLRGPAVRASSTVPTPATPADRSLPSSTVSYADLASRVAPSVVTVRAERVVKPASREFALPEDPLLRRFFGEGFRGAPLPPRREGGLGSGVIVSEDGYVLTNHHVVDGAQRIEVDLADRRTLTATLVGSDAASDLAVLKIEAKGLTPLALGDSSHARVGDVVLAFGNPLGVGQTVTMGIISAKGRATGPGDFSFEDFLQTDAPINQGNSGGALVNLRGELIGINSQIVSPSGGNIGIGFAIPTAMAENVMNQLIHGGRVHRGQLGVTVQAVTSDIAQSLGMTEVKGALVSTVAPRSPAEQAGLKHGDVILRLNGSEITDSNSLRNQVSSTPPGSRIELTLLRDGRERTVSANLGELKEARNADAAPGQAEGGPLGLDVRPLRPEEARELGVPERRGLVVAGVDPDGPASLAGFQPGDVIREVNGKPVSDGPSLRAAVESAGRRPALVLVARHGDDLYLTLQGRG